MAVAAATLPVDTTPPAWSAPAPHIDLTGWVRAAASNYLCELAGIDPTTQANYQDRPYGAYDAINCTEDRVTQTWNTGLPVMLNAGMTLATAYAAVQNARGALTRTTA